MDGDKTGGLLRQPIYGKKMEVVERYGDRGWNWLLKHHVVRDDIPQRHDGNYPGCCMMCKKMTGRIDEAKIQNMSEHFGKRDKKIIFPGVAFNLEPKIK